MCNWDPVDQVWWFAGMFSLCSHWGVFHNLIVFIPNKTTCKRRAGMNLAWSDDIVVLSNLLRQRKILSNNLHYASWRTMNYLFFQIHEHEWDNDGSLTTMRVEVENSTRLPVVKKKNMTRIEIKVFRNCNLSHSFLFHIDVNHCLLLIGTTPLPPLFLHILRSSN